MKVRILNLLLIGSIVSSVAFSSCKKEETTTTSITTTTSTQTHVKITVENLSGVSQSSKKVDMFDKEITDTQTSSVIMSATTNSSGVATFDLDNIATDSPKTYYFGVFEQNGNTYELKGSKKVDGIKKGQESSANLVLIN